MDCHFPGCQSRVLGELQEAGLCLEHYIQNVQLDANSFAERFDSHQTAMDLKKNLEAFVCVSAAKLATIGVANPQLSDFDRARLLNAMFMLIDLRERTEKVR